MRRAGDPSPRTYLRVTAVIFQVNSTQLLQTAPHRLLLLDNGVSTPEDVEDPRRRPSTAAEKERTSLRSLHRRKTCRRALYPSRTGVLQNNRGCRRATTSVSRTDGPSFVYPSQEFGIQDAKKGRCGKASQPLPGKPHALHPYRICPHQRHMATSTC